MNIYQLHYCSQNGKSKNFNFLKNIFFLLNRVEVTFIRPNGDKIKAKGKEGDSLLDIVVSNNVDLDGFGECNKKIE